MLPVNQFILSGDPLFNSGNLSEQIQYLEEQKRIIDARQKQIQQVVNGQQVLPTQQQPQVSVWDLIDEEIEIIKSIPNFDFNIPVLGNGNISNGNITISIPFINKGIMFNQSDLETFRQLLTK